TDPTYPDTSLVLVRAKHQGNSADVKLDCAGSITGWNPVGDYEWTRVDLSTGDFQGVGGCSTGRHQITGTVPFGPWGWGWGGRDRHLFPKNVSCGYPGGMTVQQINKVVIPPVPVPPR